MPEHPTPRDKPLRILAAAASWPGSNDHSFVRAFQRRGHTAVAVSSDDHVPKWRHPVLRGIRRVLMPKIVSNYNRELLRQAAAFKPDMFFVFKGAYVQPETVSALKAQGAVAINVFPDTGFADHGPYLPRAIGLYDWVFTTKSAGVGDLAENYGYGNASFFAPCFDPEVHVPGKLSRAERDTYECDVAFIGNISEGKRDVLNRAGEQLKDLRLYIWGAPEWGQVPGLSARFKGRPVWGHEYAKAIQASSINLGLLFEGGPSAPAGDQITSRTFEIPAVGGFMLHQRTDEALNYFDEDKECAFFADADELVEKVRYYLEHQDKRMSIAAAGRVRCLASDYSVNARVDEVLARYRQLCGSRHQD